MTAESFAPSFIVDAFNEDPSAKSLVKGLSGLGSFSFNRERAPAEDEAAYKAIVANQARLEALLAKGLKEGLLKNVTVIVHTGRPCNPLSYNYKPGSARTKTLTDVLEAGGTVACVYQEKNHLNRKNAPAGTDGAEYAKAKDVYNGLLKKYPNLQDHAVDDVAGELTKEMSGASYMFETNDGKKFFYSLKSYQKQTVSTAEATAREWGIYAGEITGGDAKPAVLMRLRKVAASLATNGLTFNSIARQAKTPSAKNDPALAL